jgi:hypothetical protein
MMGLRKTRRSCHYPSLGDDPKDHALEIFGGKKIRNQNCPIKPILLPAANKYRRAVQLASISIEPVKRSGNPTGRGSRNEIEAAACAASRSRSGTSACVGSADLRTTVTIEIHVSAPSPGSLQKRLG